MLAAGRSHAAGLWHAASPILYEYGVSTLSGAVVEDTQNILNGIGQAMSVHQLRQEGLIRFVTMQKDASPARP